MTKFLKYFWLVAFALQSSLELLAQLIDNRQNLFAYDKQEKRSLPSICNDMKLGCAQNFTELDQQPTPPNSPKNNGAAKVRSIIYLSRSTFC